MQTQKQTKKVYVVTMAVPFGEEIYMGVTGSFKEAEKALRKHFPNMREDLVTKAQKFDPWFETDSTTHTYDCRANGKQYIGFIHEETISI